MKKLTLLFILLTAFLSSYSWPIISMHKDGGCFFYALVNSDLGHYVGPGGVDYRGWIVECEGCGFSRCCKPAGGIVLNYDPNMDEADNYDFDVADELIAYADEEIQNGNSSGSHTVTYQISGQVFRRVYTLTWATLANGKIQQEVDLVYVLNN